jgi:hypothetical protein
LNVSHVAIRRLPAVTGQQRIDVGRLSGLHRGGGGRKLVEDGHVVLFITDLIAHENNTALELTSRVANRKF